jgi:uncharacterized membrane protein YfcA
VIETIAVCGVAFLASALTLYAGFGLGTMLLPVFALFFPVPVAIAATAVVHLSNNIVKLLLVGRFADRVVIRRFGIPAVIGSVAGARMLADLSRAEPIVAYRLFGAPHEVTPVGLAIGLLILVFALWETVPRFACVSFDTRYLAVGGVLSGFFGGLSGHQGALRSAFLIRAGLSRDAFVGTGVVIACLVDVARLVLYGRETGFGGVRAEWEIALAATVSAITGAIVASRLLPRVSLRVIHAIVGAMLFVIAALMIGGVV